MLALRRFLLVHHRLAVALMLLALAMKLVVPTGYMISSEHGRIQITLCPSANPTPPKMAHAGMSHHGMTAGHDMPKKEHGKPEMPCAFAGLFAQLLGTVDPALLLIVLALTAAVALRPIVPHTLRRLPYLQPHLRGPPALP